jgi:hypothetical protein
MVCNRCIRAVSGILCDLQLAHGPVLLGEVVLKDPLSDQKRQQLQQSRQEEGFELIDDGKTRLIEHIKRLIIERINGEPDEAQDNLSHFLAEHLHLDYPYLSTFFLP